MNHATEHLQVIRTLMERAAVYRRALAPTSLAVGGIGSVAASVGWLAELESRRAFGLYWMTVCVVALAGAFLVVRRQSLKDSEPFWSPPTRRVAQALLPALFAGFVADLVIVLPAWREPSQAWWLPPIWMALYGCAIHAAGFFMPRGMKLFGWVFIACGCVITVFLNGSAGSAGMPPLRNAHLLMGLSFGGLHLAYGAYLFLTETRKNEV